MKMRWMLVKSASGKEYAKYAGHTFKCVTKMFYRQHKKELESWVYIPEIARYICNKCY